MKVTTELILKLCAFTEEELRELIADGCYVFEVEAVDEGDRAFVLGTGKGGLIEQIKAFQNLK